MKQYLRLSNKLKDMHIFLTGAYIDLKIEEYGKLHSKIVTKSGKRDCSDDIKKYADLGIPPHIFVGSVLPVFLGSVKVGRGTPSHRLGACSLRSPPADFERELRNLGANSWFLRNLPAGKFQRLRNTSTSSIAASFSSPQRGEVFLTHKSNLFL